MWIDRADQPMVNLDHVASIFTRKKEGYPEVHVVFALNGGSEVEWELNSYDEADGVIIMIKNILDVQRVNLSQKAL